MFFPSLFFSSPITRQVLIHWPKRRTNLAAAAAAAAASVAVAAGAKLTSLATDHAPPRDGRSLYSSTISHTIEEHPIQAPIPTSHTNAAAARGRVSAMTSKLWTTATGSSVPWPDIPRAVTRSATSTDGSGGLEVGGAVAQAGGGGPICGPQRGPGGAGGGESGRDNSSGGYGWFL